MVRATRLEASMHEKKALVFMRMILEPRKLQQAFGLLRYYARRRKNRGAVMARMEAHARINALRRSVRWLWKYRRLRDSLVSGWLVAHTCVPAHDGWCL